MTMQLDTNTQQALYAFLQGALKSNQPGALSFRNDIGDPSFSPDPAFLFAPHGTDSVRVYWNEQVPPLAAWLPVVSDDALEGTEEFLSYLVPNQNPDALTVQDGNTACPTCGDPACTTGPYGTTYCESFGKTATLGPVYRWNYHMGRIMTSSATYDWVTGKARQNRGAPKPITFTSAIDGRQMTLNNRKQIFSYMANYQWVKEFRWSLWGGQGYNGSFPGVLEVVRRGWAKENEYRIDGTGIPDNVALDPRYIDLANRPYYDHPWVIAEAVMQIVNELSMRGMEPARANLGGVPNVLVDFAFIAAPEWFTHFAKLSAKVGMLNDYQLMPNAFNVSISPNEADSRFMGMTNGALGWGYIPTPVGNVPFLPEFNCDPNKMPAEACNRAADECDTSDTYATTMRLLVRRAGGEDLLGLRYLNLNQVSDPGEGVRDYVIGDGGRWINTFPVSTNGLCERALQIGYVGMFNKAPTVQTIFTGGSYRAYLNPERYTVGSAWFKGGTDIKVATTASRDLIQTNPVSVALQIDTITGGNGIWTIVAGELNNLGLIPVGTKFQSGSYVGHVAHYSDADNSITVLGDLDGLTATTWGTLGEGVSCENCPSTETLTELTDADECQPVRIAYSGTVNDSTSGVLVKIDSTDIEALSTDDLLGGYVYISGAYVGRVARHTAPVSPGDPAFVYLHQPTSVPIADGAAITVYVDSGCESDDANVETVTAYLLQSANVPLTDTDTVYVSFVSSTGATTGMSLVTGYPQPATYVSYTSGDGTMRQLLTAQNVSSSGDTVLVDFLFQSDQVSGVYALVRIPYSHA